MSDQDEWVRLIECNDVVELHTVRATLEARGVPCRVRGEHTHGIMGAMQGAVVRSRVEVPRWVPTVARELVSTTTKKRGMLRASRRRGVSCPAAGGGQPGVTLRQDLGAEPA